MVEACTLPDPEHCAYSGVACAEGLVCDPCTPSTEGYGGCVAADSVLDRMPDLNGCQPSSGGGTTEDLTEGEESTTTGEPPVTTTIDPDTTVTDGITESSTTGPLPMCDEPDGTYMGSCPEDAPFCVDYECVRCDDAGEFTSCVTAGGAPGTVCSPEGGCVECNAEDVTACGGPTPICDTAANVCTACTAHDQCPGNAGCHLFEGSCLPSDAVFMVDLDAAMCDQAGQPYCSISGALADAGVGTQATIRVAGGTYIEDVSISPSAVVAIISTGMVTMLANNGSASVTINAGGTGYLAGLSVDNLSAAPGVQSAGDVRLDDVTIENADTGLLSTDGRVHLEDVRIIGNDLTGVSVGGTEDVTLRNVIIAGNGTGTSPRGFITTAATPFTMVYTTIAYNAGTNAGAINCVGEAIRSVRNSILISNSFMNTINCGENLMITTSVISDVDYEDEPTNVPVVDDSGLLLDVDFEIGVGSVADGVAVWEEGDPLFDINSVMRPGLNGASDAAGANEPQ